MTIEQFVPPTNLAALLILLSVLRFENARWSRAIGFGSKRGLLVFLDFFVTTTGFVALLLTIFVLGVVFWEASWQEALGLFAFSFAFGFVGSACIGWMFGGDDLWVWILATLGLWPVGFLLYQQTATLYF